MPPAGAGIDHSDLGLPWHTTKAPAATTAISPVVIAYSSTTAHHWPRWINVFRLEIQRAYLVFVLIIKGQEFMKTVSATTFSDDAFCLQISNKKICVWTLPQMMN